MVAHSSACSKPHKIPLKPHRNNGLERLKRRELGLGWTKLREARLIYSPSARSCNKNLRGSQLVVQLARASPVMWYERLDVVDIYASWPLLQLGHASMGLHDSAPRR